MPVYQDLGRAERNLRQDVVYAEPWKEMPVKKIHTKTDWMKSSLFPKAEEVKMERNAFRENESAFDRPANVCLLAQE
jgi:hypothetical protein